MYHLLVDPKPKMTEHVVGRATLRVISNVFLAASISASRNRNSMGDSSSLDIILLAVADA